MKQSPEQRASAQHTYNVRVQHTLRKVSYIVYADTPQEARAIAIRGANDLFYAPGGMAAGSVRDIVAVELIS